MTKLEPSEPYDVIFIGIASGNPEIACVLLSLSIDAQKPGYPKYLENILAQSQPGSPHRLLRAGGIIIADNVLLRGIVVDDSDANPNVAKNRLIIRSTNTLSEAVPKLKEFNRAMATDPRLEAWLMPLYDGVALARLKD